MKKFFSNIIDKAKNFVTNLTLTAKVKYVVISVLTVTIVASLLVAVSLSKSETETPTVPEDLGTGEIASIDFDTKIIFEIGGESSSVSTTSDAKENSSDTSDVISNSDEVTSGEASSDVATDKITETSDEDEPKPTDPSEDNNPDPQPEDTNDQQIDNPKPIVTTTKPQTNPKPTETTKKQQNDPQPSVTTTQAHVTNPTPSETTKNVETTTKAPETTKSTETTAKAPESTKPVETTKPTETQPQEDPPQQSGQFSVKEKKYDYDGANVSILQVENKSEQAYTITITGKFKDANGKVIKTESKTFEGFPGGWSNYFVFQPGIKYSSASWDMKMEQYTGNMIANYFDFGGKVSCQAKRVCVNNNGEEVFIITPEIIKELKEVVAVSIGYGPVVSTYVTPINIAVDTILFDTNGKILHIGKSSAANIVANEPYDRYLTVVYSITDIPWSDIDTFNMPDNLKNVTGILAIRHITEYN